MPTEDKPASTKPTGPRPPWLGFTSEEIYTQAVELASIMLAVDLPPVELRAGTVYSASTAGRLVVSAEAAGNVHTLALAIAKEWLELPDGPRDEKAWLLTRLASLAEEHL